MAAVGTEFPQRPVALDMSNIDFLPCLSLGALIQLSQVFKARDQRPVLVGLRPQVRQIVAVTRLDRLFKLREDLSTLGRR